MVGKKSKVVIGKRILRKDIRKTIAFRLLMVCIAVLLFLILFWYGVRTEKPEDLGSELGTLKWDFNQEEVVLDVLNYSVGLNNQTIDINVNWSSGEKALNAFLIRFYRTQGGCTYTVNFNLPNFGENIIYMVNTISTNCMPTNFTNVTGVEAFAQIHINLTQIRLIENITIYNDNSLTDVVDLDEYFFSLVNISYSAVGDPNDRIGLSINITSNNITFNPNLLDRHGSYAFNLTAVSDDGDVLNVSSNGGNMTFYVIFIDSNRPVPNNAPEYLDDCNEFEIDVNKNSNMVIDMENCFEDGDNDGLSFRFTNSSMKNINIEKSGSDLTLTPKSGFVGKEYFYIYVNDSREEVRSDRIYVDVFNSSNVGSGGDNGGANNGTNGIQNESASPKIKSSSPISTKINIFEGGSKLFSVSAENYDVIEWYLDGKLIKTESTNYNASGLEEGNHSIKVDIKKGNEIDSKIWNLIILGEERGEKPVFETGRVVFWLIVVIIGIIILLTVWLLMVEKNKNRVNSDFGSVIINKSPSIRASSKDFNISGR